MDGSNGGSGGKDELWGQRDGSAQASGNLDKVTLLGLRGIAQNPTTSPLKCKLMRRKSTKFKHKIGRRQQSTLIQMAVKCDLNKRTRLLHESKLQHHADDSKLVKSGNNSKNVVDLDSVMCFLDNKIDSQNERRAQVSLANVFSLCIHHIVNLTKDWLCIFSCSGERR